MNMRILHLYEPSPESPYLSAQAAANHWLPAALRSLDHEVVSRPLVAEAAEDLAELSRHFDVVHVFGDVAEGCVFNAPVLQTRWDGIAAVLPEVAASWRRARSAHRPPVAVVPPGVPTAEIEPAPERNDHFATTWMPGEDRALAGAVAVARWAERELVVLIPEGAQAPTDSAPLVRLVEATRDAAPRELVSAAAFLSLTNVPADMGAYTALTAGVPVLTLSHLGAAEVIVSGESGYACDSLDELKFASERLELLRPQLGRTRAQALFDTEGWATRMADVYASVAAGMPPVFRHPEKLVAAR